MKDITAAAELELPRPGQRRSLEIQNCILRLGWDNFTRIRVDVNTDTSGVTDVRLSKNEVLCSRLKFWNVIEPLAVICFMQHKVIKELLPRCEEKLICRIWPTLQSVSTWFHIAIESSYPPCATGTA
ncbi:hypothetical protein R6Q59_009870 [Mikania micrantha]